MKHEQSFPLISLVQLMTFFGALFVCIDSAGFSKMMDRMDWDIVALLLLACLVGVLLGVFLGLGEVRRARGVVLCGGTGMVVGILMLAICLAPPSIPRAAVAVALPLVSTIVTRVWVA